MPLFFLSSSQGTRKFWKLSAVSVNFRVHRLCWCRLNWSFNPYRPSIPWVVPSVQMGEELVCVWGGNFARRAFVVMNRKCTHFIPIQYILSQKWKLRIMTTWCMSRSAKACNVIACLFAGHQWLIYYLSSFGFFYLWNFLASFFMFFMCFFSEKIDSESGRDSL